MSSRQRKAVRRQPVRVSLRPDIYEELRGIAAARDMSCSRMIETFVLGWQGDRGLAAPDTARRVQAMAARNGLDLDEVVDLVIEAGLKSCEANDCLRYGLWPGRAKLSAYR